MMKNRTADSSASATRHLFFILLSALALVRPAQPATDLFGYYENRFFLVDNLSVGWSDLGDKFDLGDYNRFRLQVKAAPTEKVTLNLAIDLYSFHGLLSSPLGSVQNPGISLTDNVKIDPDRLYVDLYFKRFYLSIGKQRLAVGVSYLWAPLDIFNRVNIMEPKEEKPGANALRLYVPMGSASSLTAIFSPQDDFQSSVSGIRGQTQVWGVDLAATFIRSGKTGTSIFGFDARGENFIGWWVEAGYFDSRQNRDWKIVLGFDYTFPLKGGLYWLSEFYYDGSGEKESSQYDFDLLNAGDRFTLGRQYCFSMLRYGFSDLFSVALSYIGNWGDGSGILNPVLQYEITQNVLLSSGCYFPLGRAEGEFNRQKKNFFFVWLKVNF